MGREVRRVPLDFDHPINKTWPGFLNNLYDKSYQCAQCGGDGSSPASKYYRDLWYGYIPFDPESKGSKPFPPTTDFIVELAIRNCKHGNYGVMIGGVQREAQRLADHFNGSWSHHLNQEEVNYLCDESRLYDFTSTFTPGEGWKKKEPAVYPTAEEVNRWSCRGMGHDSVNQWIVAKLRCERDGVSTSCEHCGGEGTLWHSEEDKLAAENWESTPPPEGGGWQVWETVSEGSPISPVFTTPEELAAHMSHTRWGADTGTSYENWLKFIVGPGWAPSMMSYGGELIDGVTAMGQREED